MQLQDKELVQKTLVEIALVEVAFVKVDKPRIVGVSPPVLFAALGMVLKEDVLLVTKVTKVRDCRCRYDV